MKLADVDGVKVAGLLLDAGPINSPSLMEVGSLGSSQKHSSNPTSLHDLYFRVGGSGVGNVDSSLVINSNHVIGDHFWIWRAQSISMAVELGTTRATGMVIALAKKGQLCYHKG